MGMWNIGKIGVWEGMECRDMVRRTDMKVIWESGKKGNMGERGKKVILEEGEMGRKYM